jgi:hypothetical protein
MAAATSYGVPLFTEGVFGRARAQDDLGVEEVGGGVLRRLIPGVIQNTPNAGYYSFYPYLLWKWEQLEGDIERDAFIPFFRRHESAFAVACALHDHRDGVVLSGVNGAIAARQRAREIEEGSEALDLDAHAQGYMDTPLGGYGLFYAVALQDARLVIAGGRGLVDRVSEHGAEVACAFAETFEQTTYAKEYFGGTGAVPAAVLRELGDATCLCTVPGRSDADLLLETFFGQPLPSPAWEERRRTRVGSLSLLLEFHDQRPTGDDDDLAAWRRALVDPQFSSGIVWTTTHSERRESWRAYQLRELSVLALTSIWSIYVGELLNRGSGTHRELAEELLSWVTEERMRLDPEQTLDAARRSVDEILPDAYTLALEAEPLPSEWLDERERAFCRALRVLLRLPSELAREARGFSELLDEGGTHRWSLAYLDQWLSARGDRRMRDAASELLDSLHHQHVRVALTKVRIPSADNLRRVTGNWRDPFNFAEDDGVLRPLRPDEPFWTGARYAVCNHLLWTLGLVTAPEAPISLTAAGEATLREHTGDA